MTPYDVVYKAFLTKILDDEWLNWAQDEVMYDLRTILEGAIPYFKFPRKTLERDECGFIENLSNEEIQIIATYRAYEILTRSQNLFISILQII